MKALLEWFAKIYIHWCWWINRSCALSIAWMFTSNMNTNRLLNCKDCVKVAIVQNVLWVMLSLKPYLNPIFFRAPLIFAQQRRAKIWCAKKVHFRAVGCAKINSVRITQILDSTEIYYLVNKRPYLSFFYLVCCSCSKTANKQLIFPCYKFCLLTLSSKGTHFFDDIFNKQMSAFYETSTYCNCGKINSAAKIWIWSVRENRRCAKKKWD